MAASSERIRRIVRRGGVKLHVFEPSGRRVWTVVGDGDEHWVDLDLGYCSCPAFHYGLLRGSAGCYHLDAATAASSTRRHATVMLSDDEYVGFVTGLLPQL